MKGYYFINRIFFLLILVMLISISGRSQTLDTINVQVTEPASILGCHQNLFHVHMQVDSTTTLNVHIEIRDSSGMADTSCTGITPVIISLESSNPLISGITYYPLTSTWSCTLAPGTIDFNLLIAIDCSIIPMNDQGELLLSSVHLWHEWTSNANDYYELDSTNANSAVSANIISPWLVDISPDNYPTAYGITSDIFFEYKNNGVGSNIKFVFDPGISCSGYIQNSLKFGIRDTSGNVATYWSYSALDSQSVFLDHNFSVVIKRSITVIDCLAPCNNESGIFKWRCDSLPGSDTLFCEDCQEIFQSSYTVQTPDSLRGRLTLERISPNMTTAFFDFSCPGDPLSWAFRLKNVGFGTVAYTNYGIGYNGTGSNLLTDVPLSSVVIDSIGCVGCTIDTAITMRNFVSFCGIPDPVSVFQMNIHELAGGDSIDVTFSTMRCCSENDALLLDVIKYFNHWQIAAVGTDSCGSITTTNVPGANYPHLGGTYGISGQSVNNYADVVQDLAFIPSVSDLNVPKDSIFGEIAAMNIIFEGLFPQIVDYQIVGCNDDPNCLMNGYLRAKIYTEVGLHISDFSSVYFHSDTIADWHPDFYYTTIDTMQCDSGFYYFYFNLADSSARGMLEAGHLMFTFQACCGAIEMAQSDYMFSFHLLMNPDNCSTISPPVNIYTPPVCTSCCWLPLSSKGDNIAVHCPGCVAPGIIVDAYSLERLNYGLQDADNDMVADSALIQIQKGDTFFDSHSFIRSTFSMHGDQIQDVMVAHFEPGSNYTYVQMIDSPGTARLNYLQLLRTIGQAPTMELTVKDFDFYIDVPDSNGGCKDCEVQNVVDTLYRTIQQNFISNDSLSSYMLAVAPGSDSTYFYTFGIDSLNNNLFRNIVFTDSLTIFTDFAENQRYRLVVRYNVCGNWQSSTTDSWKQSNITNFMWLTGSEKPWNTPDSPAPDTVVFPVNQSFADSCLFYCEKFGGRHFFVSNEYSNVSGIENNGCNNFLGVHAITSIGGANTGDVFPNEIRIPAFKPVNYRIELPFGMSLDSAFMFSKNKTSVLISDSGHFSVTPDANNHYIFDESIYVTPKCFTDTTTVPLDSTFYTFDQFSGLVFSFELEMDSCQAGMLISADSLIFINFSDNKDGCVINTDTTCSGDTLQLANVSGGVLIQPNPNLFMQVELLTISATQTEICWDFTISNPVDTSLNYPFSTTAAYNLYLIPPDSATFLNLQGWYFTVAGNPTQIFPDTNGVIHLSNTLLVGSLLTGSICANFVDCYDEAGDTLSLSFLWGWNCDDYPVPGDTIQSCNENIDTLLIDDSPGQISSLIVKFNPDSVFLCDTMYFGALFPAEDDGFVYPDSLYLTDLPVGLNIINAYIGRDSSSVTVDSLLLPNTFPGWAITDSIMAAIGYTQFGFNNPGILKMSYFAIPGCGYNESLPTHNLVSHNYCFDTTTTVIPHNDAISILGSHCSNCFTVTKTASQDTVIALSDTVTYTITVCANNGAPEAISLTENLPTDFNVISSNFPSTDTIPADTCLVYIVTGTFTFGGNCTQSCNSVQVSTPNVTVGDTLCITVLPSCFSWSYTLIPDSALSSSYPSTISNDTLFISGVFLIDSTLTLSNCVVFANACAQIVILAPAALILDSTLVEGCDQMWQGIYMNTNTSIAVQHRSTVRDANIAIFANDGTELKIVNSSFEDFIKGIYIPPNNSGFNSIVFQAIYGNRFGLFGTALKTPYLGQPAFGTIPRSGIEVNDVVWHLNYAAADSNYFYNLNKGVIGYRSKLTVENNKFSSVIPDAFYTDPWDGSAISSIGDQGTARAGSLTVIPLTSGAPTIESSEVGVHTDYSDLDISNVHMTDMGTGIFTNYCTNMLHSNVVNNIIEAREFGINWLLNIGAKKMIADNNNIYMAGTSSIGISMKEGSVASTANYILTNNYIENDGGTAGIVGQTLLSAEIRQNIVRIGNNTTTQMNGIAIYGNESSQISCNNIKGDGVSAADTLQHGIHVSISNYCDVSCNSTDSTGWGIFFGGICAQTSFRGNFIDDHFEGLRLNSVAVTDTQTHAGNRWSGSYGNNGWGAVNMNAVPQTNVRKSLLEVDPSSDLTLLPSTPTSSVSPIWPDNAGWFDVVSGTAFSCSDSSICDDSRHRASSEDIRISIAVDSSLTSDFIPESKSIAKDYLYQELKKDSASITNNILSNFVSAQSVLSIGYLYEAKKALSESYHIDSSTTSTLNSYRSQIQLYTDSLYYIDSLQIINPLTNYSSQRESIIYQLTNVQSFVTSLMIQIQSEIAAKLTIAGQNNSLVQSNEIPEENHKFINTIEILFRIGGKSAILTYLPQLNAVAEQCPYKGGTAVYKARTFVSLFGEGINYDDQNVCAQQGIYRYEQPYNSDKHSVRIIPNPANDYFEIFFLGFDSNRYELKIHDAVGKLIYNKISNSKSLRIDISKLVPGVYSVDVKINANTLHEKFVIVR